MNRLAIVTGGNRGLGLETCRRLAEMEYRVILTARDPHKGEMAVAQLREAGLDVLFQRLDVTDDASCGALYERIESEYGWVNVLVNNAGVLLENRTAGNFEWVSALNVSADIVRRTMETNAVGAFRLCQLFVPLMKRSGYGRIVNVSSGMGQLSDMDGGWPAYRMSKTAMNAVTRVFAAETKGTNVLINSVCPGWVRTDMGGPGATRSLEQGAETIVWAATLPDGGPSGGFFRDKEPIPW